MRVFCKNWFWNKSIKHWKLFDVHSSTYIYAIVARTTLFQFDYITYWVIFTIGLFAIVYIPACIYITYIWCIAIYIYILNAIFHPSPHLVCRTIRERIFEMRVQSNCISPLCPGFSDFFFILSAGTNFQNAELHLFHTVPMSKVFYDKW